MFQKACVLIKDKFINLIVIGIHYASSLGSENKMVKEKRGTKEKKRKNFAVVVGVMLVEHTLVLKEAKLVTDLCVQRLRQEDCQQLK